MIPIVDGWFENPGFQVGNSDAFQPPNQLFRLAGKHGSADHFDPAAGTLPNIRFNEHDGMKSDVGLQVQTSPYPLSGKTNPFDMETAEQLLEKLNRQFRAGEPAAVLLRTLTALENAIRHNPPRVRDTEIEMSPLTEVFPQTTVESPEPESQQVIAVLEVDEAEIEEELRALREAAELRQIRQQHLRPDLAHLDDDIILPRQPVAVQQRTSEPAGVIPPPPEPTPLETPKAPPSSAIKVATELNDAMADQGSSLNDKFRQADMPVERAKFLEPIPDIRKAIGINDRFRFVNDLFAGDSEAFSTTIGLINSSGSYAEARRWLEEKIKEAGLWQPDHPSLLELLQLLERRYS
jgi:hypothetical protein